MCHYLDSILLLERNEDMEGNVWLKKKKWSQGDLIVLLTGVTDTVVLVVAHSLSLYVCVRARKRARVCLCVFFSSF